MSTGVERVVTSPSIRARSGGRQGRTVVLGLDSVDLLLVREWASQGLLPFFASLLEECPLVRLAALSRVVQGSIWPSILTGLSPGQHGHYCFSQLTRGTYHLERRHATQVVGERFYTRLGASGMRSAIVDVPTDLLHENFPGLQIVDWGTEFQYSKYGTEPLTLRAELEERFGKHPFTDYPGTGDSVDEHRKLRDEMLRGIRLKSALTRHLLERDDLDLIFVVYGEPHRAGHFFWKYHDAKHPDHPSDAPDMQTALLEQYQLLDRELEDLSGRLSADDNLMILADHGMRAAYRGEHFIDDWLEKIGLSQSTLHGRLGGKTSHSRVIDFVKRRSRRLLRNAAFRLLPATSATKLRGRFGDAARIDWSRTPVFLLPTDHNSYLRINLRGREPQGCVEPGEEYENLLSLLERELRNLVNGETGRPAVDQVFRVQELYPGPFASDLPDLSVLWNSESPINVLESPSIGRLEKRIAERRSGNHRAEGFIVARGPAFRSGAAELQGDVLQIPSTLLALHGVEPDDSYEMGPMTELLATRLSADLSLISP